MHSVPARRPVVRTRSDASAASTLAARLKRGAHMPYLDEGLERVGIVGDGAHPEDRLDKRAQGRAGRRDQAAAQQEEGSLVVRSRLEGLGCACFRNAPDDLTLYELNAVIEGIAVTKGKFGDAIFRTLADGLQCGLNQPDGRISMACEEILLSEGRWREAYDRYAFEANRQTAYLATFQAMTSKYPQIEPKAILGDLVDRTCGDEGKWFVAAKSAGLLDEAAELANTSPCDPKTLTRSARDFAARKPEFARANFGLCDKVREGRMGGHLAAADEQEALAGLAQDVELEGRGRVQADQHQPALVPQPAKEIQHEADVAVLRVELRLVE